MAKTKTIITKDIINALKKAAEDVGSESELARKSGVNQTTLNMISNNQTQSITKVNWEKLFPYIKPYLKTSEGITIGAIGGGYGSIAVGRGTVTQHAAPVNTPNIAETVNAAIMEYHQMILDMVMDSDLDDAAKIKIYALLRQAQKQKQEG